MYPSSRGHAFASNTSVGQPSSSTWGLSFACRARALVGHYFQKDRNWQGVASPKELTVRLLTSVDRWNRWRIQHPGLAIDLTGVGLRGANLSGANLSGVVLRGACLAEATLRGANLQDADLQNADLSRASLRGTLLGNANFRGAILWHTDLRDAVLPTGGLECAHLHKVVTSRDALQLLSARKTREGSGLESAPVLPQ